MILSGGPHEPGPQQEARRCLIPSLQSLPLVPFYSMFLIYVKCETRAKKTIRCCLISAAAAASIFAAYSPPLGKAARAVAPRGADSYFKAFPIFTPRILFTIFISYWIFFVYIAYFLELLNCREWRMDVPFKDVVFDTADPHGSALSLLPLLFPDRKIGEMRVSALTQGTTNGVSIASYRPPLYQVHGTFSLKSKIGSFSRLPSMQARQTQC